MGLLQLKRVSIIINWGGGGGISFAGHILLFVTHSMWLWNYYFYYGYYYIKILNNMKYFVTK